MRGSKARDCGKGLDIGTSFVRSAERQAREIVFRTERNAFIDIEQQDFTEAMLTRARVEYVKSGDQLHIVGNKAMEFANVSNRDARRPLSSGIISPSEKEALPMIEMINKGVLGMAEPDGEPLYYSVPGPPLDAEANVVYHEKTLQGLLQRLGYSPKPINEGLAVVFSELGDHRFTGIGMSFGGGMVNVCFAFRSIPVLTFSLAKAGDWIDQNAALAVGEKASLICSIKESTLDLSKREELSKIDNALSICYDKLISYVLDYVSKEIAKTVRIPRLPEPLPIILAGGTASPRGFAERFTQALRENNFPLGIGEVKMAKNPFICVATGALIVSQADEGRGEEVPLSSPPRTLEESEPQVPSRAADE
ncbi:MAG: hypothetical protein ACE5I8_00335 [Thermodesulfobacteriota bacterium]